MTSHFAQIWDKHLISRIIDSMADGVFTMDTQGLITSWNRAMEHISGYSAAEALGQTCALLGCSRCFGQTCPADIGQCNIYEKGGSEAKECLLQHKDGHDIPVIKKASVVQDDQGKILGVVETVTDLTELNQARKRAEEASFLLEQRFSFANILGKSEAMVRVFTAIEAAAASDATVLIQGESGTGKELIAKAIHYQSERRTGPLITVNCSALPESLLESELFGHAQGAYTGAQRARAGRFERADGGSLFLDEIGELSPYIQVKLLRVLQERTVERLGETRTRKVDLRIISATHRDLWALLENDVFREDLYYRLNVFPIRVPPLRKRRDDIPLLTRHFITKLREKTGKHIMDTSHQVAQCFLDYHWPGNVRELENAIEHAFVLCRTERIEVADLPETLRFSSGHEKRKLPGRRPRSAERSGPPSKQEVLHLLKKYSWNKAEVARQLGVSHTSVWKYMKKYGIPLNRNTR